jgi:predicted transcriptional regulator
VRRHTHLQAPIAVELCLAHDIEVEQDVIIVVLHLIQPNPKDRGEVVSNAGTKKYRTHGGTIVALFVCVRSNIARRATAKSADLSSRINASTEWHTLARYRSEGVPGRLRPWRKIMCQDKPEQAIDEICPPTIASSS